MAMAQRGKRQDVWRNAERHFCAVCNAWMGSDRQSILIHENGKKHKENLEKSLNQKRLDKLEQEKSRKLLQSSLQAVERAAAAAHAQDVTYGGYVGSDAVAAGVSLPSQSHPPQHHQAPGSSSKKEKREWESRKKKREQEKAKNAEEEDDEPVAKKAKRKKIGPDEGHYSHGDTTYLEGPSFAELLEEDMPIQIWIGSGFASMAEKRLPESHHHWRNGLVVAVRKSSTDTSGIVLDVAYLMQVSDTEETLEKSVSPSRIRILLGSDESIPDTIEEARLAVMGGEVTEVQQSLDIDENTGLSSWGTVSIRKTTVRTELKEERSRARKRRREEMERLEKERKDAEARKMEEAKVENADDSALGAYDVWSSGKGGYKGVDISGDSKLDVQDTAKCLSKGMGTVGFKKGSSAFKKARKNQNRRTTSADD